MNSIQQLPPDPSRCEFCCKEFTLRRKYQRHLRQHTGERRHKCEECGAAFLQEEFLARHRLTHSGENPHKCPHCGRGFNQVVNLKQHVERVHVMHGDSADPTAPGEGDCGQGARRKTHNFLCSECGKGFFSAAELRNHSVYHGGNGARRHQCAECAAAFFEKRHLDR